MMFNSNVWLLVVADVLFESCHVSDVRCLGSESCNCLITLSSNWRQWSKLHGQLQNGIVIWESSKSASTKVTIYRMILLFFPGQWSVPWILSFGWEFYSRSPPIVSVCVARRCWNGLQWLPHCRGPLHHSHPLPSFFFINPISEGGGWFSPPPYEISL